VTAKCYGGDVQPQTQAPSINKKRAREKMRQYGNVEIPQSAFIAALRMNDDK